MAEKLQLNVHKIYMKKEMSTEREIGIEISSKFVGLKYIIIDNSIVFSTIKNGVFSVDLDKSVDFAREIIEISEMYNKEK